MTYLAQQDPWQSYDAAAKKHKPVVPKAETYGALLIGVLLLVMWVRRGRR